MNPLLAYLADALGSDYKPDEFNYSLVRPENAPAVVASGGTVVRKDFKWAGEEFVVVAKDKPAEAVPPQQRSGSVAVAPPVKAPAASQLPPSKPTPAAKPAAKPKSKPKTWGPFTKN